MNNNELNAKDWWAKRRLKYNIGLVVAGLAAFISYAILGELLIAPYDNGFEITLFTTVFQGFGYLIMMLFANLFYYLGYFADRNFNKTDSVRFRERLYRVGFYFSVGLPFLIPILIVVMYFIRFAGHK